ncbi:MAG: hypothetical protein LQ340_005134 [Diploschistes diacapsis]|nr:MAG: hypothetical protein LQ340_005134 [Diploschistes diacapsis]
MISMPIIIVIVILATALLTTSALLVWKLRPGRASEYGKPNNAGGEAMSPVRKLTLMRGKVVSSPSSPRRSFFRGWPTSLYVSPTGSQSSFPNLLVDQVLKSPVVSTTPRDLEAQTFAPGKRTLTPIDERGITVTTEPIEKIGKDGRQASGKQSTLAGPKRQASRNTQEGSQKHVRDEGYSGAKELPKGPEASTPSSRKSEIDPVVVEAASVSAKPASAYSSKPTPSSSVKSHIHESPSTNELLPNADCHIPPAPPSPEVSEPSETISDSHDSKTPSTVQEAGAWNEPKVDSPTSPIPLVKKSRPPPIAVLPHKRETLPTVLKTAPSNEKLTGTEPRSPATSIYSPGLDSIALSSQSASGERLPSPPPFLSATITNMMSTPIMPMTVPKSRQSMTTISSGDLSRVASKKRRSVTTIASNDLSPTFSLASVRRVPLYPAGEGLQLQERKSSHVKQRAGEQKKQLARKPMSVLQTASSAPPPAQWPPRILGRQSIQSQDYSLIMGLPGSEPADLVRDSLISQKPFEKPPTPLQSPYSAPPPPKTAYAGPSLGPRDKLISIPTGRRRSSRYSHLFEKALPTPPTQFLSILGGIDEHANPLPQPTSERPHTSPEQAASRPVVGARRMASVHATLPSLRDSRLWSAPSIQEISPMPTPDRRKIGLRPKKSGGATVEERPMSEVSPLSERFSTEAMRAGGRRRSDETLA